MSLIVRLPKNLELFLDDGFSNAETAGALRAASFVVHEFVDSFPRIGDPSKREEGIGDPPIIELCHSNNWLLVTLDKNMCKKHRADIRKHRRVAILATAHNKADTPTEWVDGIIKLKAELEDRFSSSRRPWFLIFSREGKITAERDKMF